MCFDDRFAERQSEPRRFGGRIVGRGELSENRRQQLGRHPESVTAARRLVWALLRQHRHTRSFAAEGLAAAERLASLTEADDLLSLQIIEAARRVASLSAGQSEETDARLAVLPVFTSPQLRSLGVGFHGPEARLR